MNNEMPLKQVIDSTLENLKNIMSTDTVIGQPMHVMEDTVIIPVSKVSVGFTSGGVDFDSKTTANKHFGGGNGAGMSVNPIAFLVVTKNGVELLNINKEYTNTLADTVSDFVAKSPDLISKFKEVFNKEKKEETTEESTEVEEETKE